MRFDRTSYVTRRVIIGKPLNAQLSRAVAGDAIVQSWNLSVHSAGVPTGGKIAFAEGFMQFLSGSLLSVRD